MNRDRLKKRVEERKEPYWDRRINIAHRSINRKKYYGVGVEIDSYVEKVRDAVDVEDAVDVLKNQRESFTRKESLIDDIAGIVTVGNLDSNNALFAEISKIFSDSFKKGTRRLFTKEGDRVDVDQFVDQSALNSIMKKQNEYFENLSEDIERKTRDTLGKGFEEGKSMQDIGKDLEKEIDNLTRNRANTIARSEVIKASSKGTQATMKKAGVDRFMWLSARDNDVCEAGNFRESFNGTTYTSCREYDGETFQREMNHPEPVRDSHPNCRCTLVAEVDDE